MAHGRPSTAQYPVITARHLDTGRAVAWSDGQFAGDPALTRDARIIATAELPVELGPGAHFATNAGTPSGAACAMIAACRGRAELRNHTTAPDEGWSDVQE